MHGYPIVHLSGYIISSVTINAISKFLLSPFCTSSRAISLENCSTIGHIPSVVEQASSYSFSRDNQLVILGHDASKELFLSIHSAAKIATIFLCELPIATLVQLLCTELAPRTVTEPVVVISDMSEDDFARITACQPGVRLHPILDHYNKDTIRGLLA